VSFLWIAGVDYKAAVRRVGGDDLRVVGVLRGVFSGRPDDPVSTSKLIELEPLKVRVLAGDAFFIVDLTINCLSSDMAFYRLKAMQQQSRRRYRRLWCAHALTDGG
jgi:hypothetical protein